MAGTISGTAVDTWTNQPIDGAAVAADPGNHITTTGGDGTYSLSLDAGQYSMTISATGFQPFLADGIVVLDDVTTTIDVSLPRAD